MARILLLEGPNLDLLGLREPSLYGTRSAQDVHADLRRQFSDRCELECFQSNHEGVLVDRVGDLLRDRPADGLVVNAGALTHTSIALRDALLATNRPFVEVHLSNVFAREDFRHHSWLSDVALGVIVGLGPTGYALGLSALLEHLDRIRAST